MTRICLTLDLKNDQALIQDYESHHKKVWPQVISSIKDSGITEMEIYRWGNRLFMIMETDDTFSFDRKRQMDADNPVVREWERLMWGYQQSLPTAAPGEKWQLMQKIFSLPGDE